MPGNVVARPGDGATGRLVIFLHGLCENDLFWSFGAERAWGDPQHDLRLEAARRARVDAALRPLQHRPAHLRERPAARRVSRDLVRRWPVPVTEIAIVGHSMGGLVARTAAHIADDRGHRLARARCGTSSASARRTSARRSSAG